MIYELIWIMLYFFGVYLLSILGMVICGLISKEHDKKFFHKTYEDLIMIGAGLAGFVYILLSYLAKFGGVITAIVFIGYILSKLTN